MKSQPVLDPKKTQVFGLILEPHGPFLFRDGRPFGAADFAQSLNAPLPQTLSGMIQTRLMQVAGLEPKQYHNAYGNEGLDDDQRAVRMVACRGPWYAWTGKNGQGNGKEGEEHPDLADVYVPAPATLVFKDKKKETLEILNPVDEKKIETIFPGWKESSDDSCDLWPLLATGDDLNVQPADEYFLGRKALKLFLGGKKEEVKDDKIIPLEDLLVNACFDISRQTPIKDGMPAGLFCYEDRTGLEIGKDTGTAEEGQLFSTRRLRLAPGVVFYAEIGIELGAEDPDRQAFVKEKLEAVEKLMNSAFPPNGVDLLPFGGEGGRVTVRLTNRWDWEKECYPKDLCAALSETKPGEHFFSLMISPTIFRANANADDNRPPWYPGNLLGNLRAAAVSRPLAISGWSHNDNDSINRAAGHPRPTRYAVPAGSVYFWERGNCTECKKEGEKNGRKEFKKDIPCLHQIAESPADRAKGWGLALKGIWPPENLS
jgi:CRISPR-associated protein Cmr3